MSPKKEVFHPKMFDYEQAAYDTHREAVVPVPEGLLASAPVLQCPAKGSMGVAFAVSAYSIGYAEVSDKPSMEGTRRFISGEPPLGGCDDRVQLVRMTGLKPGRIYYYRVGAAALGMPTGYWTKQSGIVWSGVHSFTMPGAEAPSRFAMVTDTHGAWDSFGSSVSCLHRLAPPVWVLNGDVCTHSNTREDLIEAYLCPPKGADYAADFPVLFNPGNHDYRGRGARLLPSVMMERPLAERASAFGPLARNFALRYGDIALIGLETGEDKPDEHPANGGFTRFTEHRRLQTRWLERQFKRPEIASAPYVVAFVHIPIFDADPHANPGTILENFADWQGECGEFWGPILTANRVQLVLAGHCHRFRHDPAAPDRSWAQIVGGGPKNPTVIEGAVEDGALHVRVYDPLTDANLGEFTFAPRRPNA